MEGKKLRRSCFKTIYLQVSSLRDQTPLLVNFLTWMSLIPLILPSQHGLAF